MKLSEVMSHPAHAVSSSDGQRVLERLVALGHLRHLPIIDDGRLVGMWLADQHGRLRMVGPEEVVQTAADTRAEDAVADLLTGKQAVLAWEDGAPVGVLTGADVLNIARVAMAHGIGRRIRRPVVIRLTGPEGGGKTLLLLRTVRCLHHCSVGVVQADDRPLHVRTEERLEGARVLTMPRDQLKRGLKAALEELSDAQLVLIEDRADARTAVARIGEDHQVLVLPADKIAGLAIQDLLDAAADASALVISKLDTAPAGFDFEQTRREIIGAVAGLTVVGVAARADDRGPEEWRDWLLARALPASSPVGTVVTP